MTTCQRRNGVFRKECTVELKADKVRRIHPNNRKETDGGKFVADLQTKKKKAFSIVLLKKKKKNTCVLFKLVVYILYQGCSDCKFGLMPKYAVFAGATGNFPRRQ